MQHIPLVSIIIPTHNRPDLLEEAIKSIALQSITDWEAIIVDDNSTPAVDQSSIQKKFGDKFKVIHHQSSKGGALAKNTGIETAKGDYIAFLDDDDLYAPTYLEKAIKTLKENPQLDTLFMGVSWFGENAEWAQNDYNSTMQKTLSDTESTETAENLLQFNGSLFNALLKRIPMAFQRPVTHKQTLEKIGNYQNTLLWDCEWALRASLNGTCGLLTDGLYQQRTAGQGYSSTPNRRLDHMLSNLQMKRDLYTNKRALPHKKLLSQAIIQAGKDLSWEYIIQKKGLKAVHSMLDTFHYGFSLIQIKFLLHAAYTGVNNLLIPNKPTRN